MSVSDSTNPLEKRPKVRLTMRQGARHVGCSPRHFYDLAYEGEVPTYLAAGHRWVDEEDLDGYIARLQSRWAAFWPSHRQATARKAEAQTAPQA